MSIKALNYLLRLASILLIVGPVIANASLSAAQTLKEALVSSYDFSPELAAQRARTRASDENIFSALSAWRPTVTITGTGTQTQTQLRTDSVGPTTGIKADGATTETDISLNLSYTLYEGGGAEARLSGARKQSDVARADLMSTEQRILTDASGAYIDVLVTRRALTALEQYVADLQAIAKNVETLVNNGQRTIFDLADTRTQLGQAMTTLAAQQKAVGVAVARYRQTIGTLPGRLAGFPALSNLPTTHEAAVDGALLNNPDVVSAQATVSAAQQAVEEAKAKRRPTIVVSAGVGREDVHSREPDIATAGNTTEGTVSASLTVPLFQGGAEFAAIRQAKQTENEQRLNLAAVQERLRQQAMSAWVGLVSGRNRVTAAEDRLTAATVSDVAAKQRLETGQLSMLDALIIKERYVLAQITLVRASGEMWRSEVNLLQTVGRYGARDIELNVVYYDPEAYYSRTSDNEFSIEIE